MALSGYQGFLCWTEQRVDKDPTFLKPDANEAGAKLICDGAPFVAPVFLI